MKSKKTVMIVLCIAVAILATVFAAFSTRLTINGLADITSDWKVLFTDIELVSMSYGMVENVTPTAEGTTAIMNVDLNVPGDSVTYRITIENQGTVDAIIENIYANELGNEAIKFEISNIKIGDILEHEKSTTFDVTISYDRNAPHQTNTSSNELRVEIVYVQYTGQVITEKEPEIIVGIPTTLAEKLQNEIAGAQSDENIDFGSVSSDTNGKGMYYTSENTENNQTVYYYRGEVDNNYVKFGTHTRNTCIYNGKEVLYWGEYGETEFDVPTREQCLSSNVCNASSFLGNYFVAPDEETTIKVCEVFSGTMTSQKAAFTEDVTEDILWRIVRVNEDGSIRLITDSIIGMRQFTNVFTDNAYIGYMYGTVGATGDNAYDLTHTNTYNSAIKGFLDDWYTNKSNLSNNNNLMSTTAGFCNDRSIASQSGLWNRYDTALGYGANVTYYGAYNRLVNNKEPQYACPNEGRDLFTVTGSSVGNAKLTNPIGLLSADEYAFLGGAYSGDVSNNFLKIDFNWFLGSPYSYDEREGSQMYVVHLDDGKLVMDDFHINFGVRPVINLKPSALVTRGTGISTDPYIIKTN